MVGSTATAAAASAAMTGGGTQPPTNINMDEHERKIVLEFCHLLEKSKQLFNGLRDLPQYGHKQWQAYFGRTFDIYTRLWKFQQQHRAILDSKYGLKRWQIGEIASKIGQLYYHYYLRTSETGYLHEAYSFYSAIRGRAYYSRAAKEDRSELMVKKLRYYARFIVVCLLLRRMKLVRELVQELDRHVADYTATYEPDDQLEWSLVLDEIKAFVAADAMMAVIHSDTSPVVLSHRLSPLTTPPVERSTAMSLTLQEILIVGNCCEQVKFSELTMDMFRMLQTLEREPLDDGLPAFNHHGQSLQSPAPHHHHHHTALNGGGGGPHSGSRRDNPHKYLLYRPTLSQIVDCKENRSAAECPPSLRPERFFVIKPYNLIPYMNTPGKSVVNIGGAKRRFPHVQIPCANQGVASAPLSQLCTDFVLVFLASGCRELPPNGALLLYLSADGCFSTSKHPEDVGYDLGGVLTSSSKREHTAPLVPPGQRPPHEPHCLHPGDLYPFTRRPLFLVVDSDNSFVFQHIPRYFGQPLVTLMSPQDIPDLGGSGQHGQHSGSLFTLFLHSPLQALCRCCCVPQVPAHHWERCQSYIDRFVTEASRLVTRSNRVDPSYIHFFGDDFLRGRQFRPRCQPPLPEHDLLDHPQLNRLVLDLAHQLDVRHHFIDAPSGDRQPSSVPTSQIPITQQQELLD